MCPWCAGTGPCGVDGDPDAVRGWRVRCHACGWDYATEGPHDEAEEPLTARQAREVARYHHCDPDVWVLPPSGEQAYREYEITDTGQLSTPVRMGV
jgi:hypothetical protein